jgi:hypothetical protein
MNTDNRCPICESNGYVEFLINSYDTNSDCWLETCTSEGKSHDCEYCLLHIERRKTNIPVETERRKNGLKG